MTRKEKKEKKTSTGKLILTSSLLIAVVLVLFIGFQYHLNNQKYIKINSETTPAVSAKSDINIYINKTVEEVSRVMQVDKDKIVVVSSVEKIFSDTSLGCPKAGKIYAQMIVKGYQITVKVLDKIFTYNAGLDKIISC